MMDANQFKEFLILIHPALLKVDNGCSVCYNSLRREINDILYKNGFTFSIDAASIGMELLILKDGFNMMEIEELEYIRKAMEDV
jgi:hypothetical protein